MSPRQERHWFGTEHAKKGLVYLIVELHSTSFDGATIHSSRTEHHRNINMPARTSARPSSPSGPPHKASSQKLSSRKTTTASAVDIPDEGPSTSLRMRICEVFGDAQKSTAGHRKSATSLRKIQEECCYMFPHVRGQKNQEDEFGEDDFNVEVARCVIRLMGVKKSEGVGDRLVKFLGLFLRRATDKGKLTEHNFRKSGC